MQIEFWGNYCIISFTFTKNIIKNLETSISYFHFICISYLTKTVNSDTTSTFRPNINSCWNNKKLTVELNFVKYNVIYRNVFSIGVRDRVDKLENLSFQRYSKNTFLLILLTFRNLFVLLRYLLALHHLTTFPIETS